MSYVHLYFNEVTHFISKLNFHKHHNLQSIAGIYILAIFVQIEKQGLEFEGGHENRKGKGGKEEKKKRVIKHTLKYLYED